jgi:hypothetical protein
MQRIAQRTLAARAGLLALACFTLTVPHAFGAAAVDTTTLGPVDVTLPTILAPMIVESRLQNYAYITIVLEPAAPAGVLAIREKVPFLQDAFLRELNAAPIVKSGDPKSVDEEAVKARLVTRMNGILPAGTVAELKLQPIVVAPVQAQR